MRTPLHSALACALAAFAAACAPDEHARGRALFRTQGCATCHGESGEGLPTAPPLRGLGEHWESETLSEYLRFPRAFVEREPRLTALRDRYAIEMPATAVTEEERLVLADYVLSL